jgi:anti-anti-sigma factor
MQPARLTTGWQRRDQVAVLDVHGEIDLATVQDLRIALDDAPEATDVVVDLGHVTFLDSTGITALIVAHRAAVAAGARFALAAATGPVKRVLDVSGVAAVVPTYDSVEAAME